jgi:hypothetical protein
MKRSWPVSMYHLAVPLCSSRKPRNTSLRRAGVVAGIRTKHLPNTSLALPLEPTWAAGRSMNIQKIVQKYIRCSPKIERYNEQEPPRATHRKFADHSLSYKHYWNCQFGTRKCGWSTVSLQPSVRCDGSAVRKPKKSRRVNI